MNNLLLILMNNLHLHLFICFFSLMFSLNLAAQDSTNISENYVNEDTTSKKKSFEIKTKRFRLSGNIGLSRWVGANGNHLPAELENYKNELKSGYSYSIESSYALSKSFGIGAKYNDFKTKNTIEDVAFLLSNNTISTGTISDNISIKFIGGSVYYRVFTNNLKSNFFLSFSIGSLFYNNDIVFLNNFELSGASVGFVIDAGYELKIAESLSVNFLTSWTNGSLQEFEVASMGSTQKYHFTSDPYESLSHFDFSIGLVFHK